MTIHLPGNIYGELKMLSRHRGRVVLECSCGNVIEIFLSALLQGKSDCGHIAANRRLAKLELAALDAKKGI